MPYFYCPNLESVGQLQELSSEESQHAAKTMRLKVGDKISLLDGVGHLAEAELTEVPQRRGAVLCRIESIREIAESPLKINLILASPRNNLCGQIVRQATELGVNKIFLIDAQYSVAKLKDNSVEKMHRDAIAAIKQSGNAFLPEIIKPQSFAEALKNLPGPSYYGAVPGDASLAEELPSAGEVNLWIGPEGGFSDDEIFALQKSGAKGICLGRWILRVETAVIALLGAMQVQS